MVPLRRGMSTFNVIFSTAGGLALFLYGLRVLSDALKRAIGERMRELLERLTGRAYRGAIVGALTSGILQSSSMTMVLLIGLINAGALTLSQGVGVMLGSEIGTTLTAQIIAFKIGHYYLPVIAVGFILAEIFRGKKIGDVGRIILGFGILFLGMSITSDGLRGLSESPTVLRLLHSCGTNVFLGVLVGAGVTAIIQSSSAMTAMVIAMGSAGLLTLPAAISLILGANIGTTVTGIIASIGSSRSSRRLAVVQVLVNVLGVAIFLPFVPHYADLVARTAGSLTRQIANAHTFFNVTVTLLLLPCVGGLVWLAKRVVPGREVRVDTAPRYLGNEFLSAPAIAVTQARNEVLRMGELTSTMLFACRDALLSGDRTHVATVLETEEVVDVLWRTIGDFLDQIDLGKLSLRDAKRLHVLQHVTGDIERVGDHAVNIAERAEAALDRKVTFSNEARRDLSDMFDKALHLYRLSLQTLEREDHPLAEEAFELEREVDRLEILYKESHIERVEEGICDPSAGILYVEVLRNLERIGDHAVNIAGDVLLV
jgi:phosphate:Na+ symporter